MKKQRVQTAILLISVLLVLAGCQKSGSNCMTNAGKIIFERRLVADFDTIDVGNYVNLYLTQDSANSVSVESGQNIIDGITTEVLNRTLFIRNINTCNWMRSYNTPVNAHISVKNLAKILYNSSGNITATTPISSSKFSFVAWGGAGTIDLNLSILEGSFALVMGTATIKLHGYATVNSVFSGDFGLIDARNLRTVYTYVKNEGSNDCYVNSSKFLDATISSIGNIYFTGAADSVVTHIKGEGRLIKF